jgi:hypothetical protein
VVLKLHLLHKVAVMVVLVGWSGHFEPKTLRGECGSGRSGRELADGEAGEKANGPEPEPGRRR